MNQTSNTLPIAIGLIIVAVVVAIFAFSGNPSNEASPVAIEDSTAPLADEMNDDMAETMDDDPAPIEADLASSGTFSAYSEEALANADGDVVIFFAADWCSKCQKLKSDIEASAAEIPEGLTILEADFDAETALKRQYGVTLQHTLVKVDSEGNELDTWSGSSTLEDILEQI